MQSRVERAHDLQSPVTRVCNIDAHRRMNNNCYINAAGTHSKKKVCTSKYAVFSALVDLLNSALVTLELGNETKRHIMLLPLKKINASELYYKYCFSHLFTNNLAVNN